MYARSQPLPPNTLKQNLTVLTQNIQVSGTCHPEIDFDMYSLVIGRQSTTREVDTIYYDYGIACPDNELTLTIEIVQGDAVVADNVVYHALIPRLKDGGTIAININIR